MNTSFASSAMDMFDCPTLESLTSLRASAASQGVYTTASGAVLRTYGLDGSSLSPASGMSSGEDMICFSPPHSPAMVPGVGQMDMNPLDLQVARHVPRPIARHDEHHHGQDAEEVSSVSSSIDTEDYGRGPGSPSSHGSSGLSFQLDDLIEAMEPMPMIQERPRCLEEHCCYCRRCSRVCGHPGQAAHTACALHSAPPIYQDVDMGGCDDIEEVITEEDPLGDHCHVQGSPVGGHSRSLGDGLSSALIRRGNRMTDQRPLVSPSSGRSESALSYSEDGPASLEAEAQAELNDYNEYNDYHLQGRNSSDEEARLARVRAIEVRLAALDAACHYADDVAALENEEASARRQIHNKWIRELVECGDSEETERDIIEERAYDLAAQQSLDQHNERRAAIARQREANQHNQQVLEAQRRVDRLQHELAAYQLLVSYETEVE